MRYRRLASSTATRSDGRGSRRPQPDQPLVVFTQGSGYQFNLGFAQTQELIQIRDADKLREALCNLYDADASCQRALDRVFFFEDVPSEDETTLRLALWEKQGGVD